MDSLAVIGCGTMGRAIVTGLLEGDVLRPEQVVGTIPDPAEATLAADALGIRVLSDNVAAVRQADVVVLAVKPQVAHQVLTDPALQAVLDGKLLINMPRHPLGTLDGWLPEVALIRAMPNTLHDPAGILAPGPVPTSIMCRRRRTSSARWVGAGCCARSTSTLSLHWVDRGRHLRAFCLRPWPTVA